MLQIKTYIGKDSRGGTGLFADEDISQGTVVWSYNPAYIKFLTIEEYFVSEGQERADLKHYSYPIYNPNGHGLDKMVGVLINTDNSRYINHSDTPNTGSSPHDINIDIALHDIKRGDEITCNYRTFDPDNFLHNKGVVTCKTFLIVLT